MEFVNEFAVNAPVDEAWNILTDVPKIAPCLPGASVTQLSDGQFEGEVAVKVGPIKVRYGGTAVFQELDADKRHMVLDARGSESSGKGSAAAIVRVDLFESDRGTTIVKVVTELQITGKIAQFGRSAMADVGERMIGQFAKNLEEMIGGNESTFTRGTSSEPSSGESGPTIARPERAAAELNELDIMSLALPLLKRALPTVVAFATGVIIGKTVFGRRNRPQNTLGYYPVPGQQWYENPPR